MQLHQDPKNELVNMMTELKEFLNKNLKQDIILVEKPPTEKGIMNEVQEASFILYI
jgi:hypothetical protein